MFLATEKEKSVALEPQTKLKSVQITLCCKVYKYPYEKILKQS